MRSANTAEWLLSMAKLLSCYWPSQVSLPGTVGPNIPTWDIFRHLGGNGPWIKKVDGIVDGGIDVPEGCNVEQVHMVKSQPALQALKEWLLTQVHYIRSLDMLSDIQRQMLAGVCQSLSCLVATSQRLPNGLVGMLTLLQRIKNSNITFQGDLDFVNGWQYFSLGPSPLTLTKAHHLH